MIKLIIFDWDDVFTVGAAEGYYACYHETLKKLGVNLSPEKQKMRIVAKWGSSLNDVFAELLKEQPELVDAAAKEFEKIMMGNTFIDHLRIVEGSQDLLIRLSKNYKLAIASGVNPRVLKEKLFPQFSIPQVFAEILTVYDLDDPSHAKPHPHMLEKIIKSQDIMPSETIFVGDAWTDVHMAQAAGITPVVVLTGQLNRKEAEQLKVKFIIDDVSKLEDALKDMN